MMEVPMNVMHWTEMTGTLQAVGCQEEQISVGRGLSIG